MTAQFKAFSHPQGTLQQLPCLKPFTTLASSLRLCLLQHIPVPIWYLLVVWLILLFNAAYTTYHLFRPCPPAPESLVISSMCLDTNLTKATTNVRKDIKALPKTPPPQAKAKATPARAPNTHPTYAAVANLPPCPSAVVKTAAYTWPAALRPIPTDICTTINTTLHSTNFNQIHVSAARWTQKGNLVIWGGRNTTAINLMSSLPTISEALQTSFSENTTTTP
ncbi:hypothetical protein F5148DRAFT_1153586 [Russula earlei]|uniref:Uncharacterized protein n=1 Tax=Russula earlei TaxID=71964 RepID=A0ACC0TVE5_9AGAM|nr:hypothetical protein F5148DRAFT_1153586 [Russula earlei]